MIEHGLDRQLLIASGDLPVSEPINPEDEPVLPRTVGVEIQRVRPCPLIVDRLRGL
ncbi:MAG: hypothetical protein ACQKBV_08890 [Puniceicoccales bacterium]